MKKVILCVFLSSMILLTGCSEREMSAISIYETITLHTEIPFCEIYRFTPDARHEGLLTALYGVDGASPDAIALCKDYVICLYNGNEIWELHIFLTASAYNNERVEDMLLQRRDLLQEEATLAYLSEESYMRVQKASVIVKGNAVILAITDDNEAIKEQL